MKFVENKQALDVINRMLEDVDNWLTKWLFKYSAQCRLNDKHLEIIQDTFYKHKLRREMLKLDKANYTYKELLDSAQACLLKYYPNLQYVLEDFWSNVQSIYEAKLDTYVIEAELNSTSNLPKIMLGDIFSCNIVDTTNSTSCCVLYHDIKCQRISCESLRDVFNDKYRSHWYLKCILSGFEVVLCVKPENVIIL